MRKWPYFKAKIVYVRKNGLPRRDQIEKIPLSSIDLASDHRGGEGSGGTEKEFANHDDDPSLFFANLIKFLF